MANDERLALIADLRQMARCLGDHLVWPTLAESAADALEATLPEEREGRCPCGYCEYVETVWCEPRFTGPREDDWQPYPVPKHWRKCPRCGAELGADGVAWSGVHCVGLQL